MTRLPSRPALRAALAALGLGLANLAEAQEPARSTAEDSPMTVAVPALTETDTTGDLLDHPALRGFAQRMLPGRDHDRNLRLAQLGILLPYHSEVSPRTTLAGINRIIADATAGKPVFHEIYADAERKADPALSEAGLFFLAGQPGAPFAIIAPGGGFAYVGAVHEGFPYAQAIADRGLNAFVLTYRTGQGGAVATRDLARAIDYVMDHADALRVSRKGYSLWGSSAGARMATFVGSHGPQAFGARTTARPASVIMAYTAHSDTGDNEPPTFVVVGGRDAIAPPAAMQARVRRLRRMSVDVEFRLFPSLGHGFGAATGTEAEGWIEEAVQFWMAHGA